MSCLYILEILCQSTLGYPFNEKRNSVMLILTNSTYYFSTNPDYHTYLFSSSGLSWVDFSFESGSMNPFNREQWKVRYFWMAHGNQ